MRQNRQFDMLKPLLLLICVYLSVIACVQKSNKTTYFPRIEINSIAPNPEVASLMSYSFEEITNYKTVDQWGQVAENIYSRPEGPAVVDAVKSLHPAQGHPRILITEESISRLKQKLKEDPLYQKWFEDVKKEADQILTLPCVDEPKRHELQNRLLPLGLVYKLSGEKKYGDRAWKELETYTYFDHWNPTTQFLDIAYITKGFAIGFDWFYNHLSKKQKQQIIMAVREKALELAMVAYQNPEQRTPYQNHKITGFDNWNSSINAGLMMVSLAMCDEDGMSELCGDIIHSGIQYWENYLKELAPDGGCVEGVKYWYWGVQSVVECVASFESATGTDYGIGKTPGLATTAYFPYYMTGPMGAFNYGNAGQEFWITPEYFWFAKKFNDPKIASARKKFMDAHETPAKVYDMLWYDDVLLGNADAKGSIPLDMWFLTTETSSFRNGWDKDALFTAMKGGDNMATHGHLNLGSFVLDAMGVRWATHLGGDRYSNPGYFRKGERNSMGYQYYRVRAEGQNTILINPDSLSDQLPRAKSRVINFHSQKDMAFSVIDMSEAYAHEAENVIRGSMIFDNRTKILLRDEIICKKSSQIFWFMHTSSHIEISENGKSALLTQNGKQLRAELFCSVKNAGFSIMNAVPLPTSPQSEYNRPNKGIQKLTVSLNGVRKVDISVVFSPVSGETKVRNPVNIRGISEW